MVIILFNTLGIFGFIVSSESLRHILYFYNMFYFFFLFGNFIGNV